MIQCIDVVKRYGDKTVLNRISVSFEKGLIHGIVGRNGSGKTMLLKAICGFIPLSGGEIRVWGKAVKSGRTPEGVGLIIEAPGSFFCTPAAGLSPVLHEPKATALRGMWRILCPVTRI